MQKEERWSVAAEGRMEMGGWHKDKMKYGGGLNTGWKKTMYVDGLTYV